MTKIIVAFFCFATLAGGCAVVQPEGETTQDMEDPPAQLREAVSLLQDIEAAEPASQLDPEVLGLDEQSSEAVLIGSGEGPDPELRCIVEDGCAICCHGSQCCTSCQDVPPFCNF